MKAVVIHETGGPEVLKIEEREIPSVEPGKVLIRIKAFGLNRSEMFTRLGHSVGKVFFPRVLGIECVGIVEDSGSDKFIPGQQVAAIMGGLGRQFDGGYAEYSLVPENIVIPFSSTLDWHVLGAIPEMCQTAYGSLEQSLQLKAGESLLIRGGTSSVGITAAQLAMNKGCRVFSTTRTLDKAGALREIGVDHILIDDGEIASKVRDLLPSGVDKVLELVGGNGIRDSLKCVKTGGILCQTGYLSNQWRMDGFSPLGEIPSGVYLTSYAGENSNLPPALLQDFIDQVANGTLAVKIDKVFRLQEIVQAHAYMEDNRASGKLVVRTED
jgi:NADPH:quinone reductase-like Zn-dependent oxidoreductase